jgi:hypothetical protein
MACFAVELFVQGKGWRGWGEVTGEEVLFSSQEEAMDHAASLIFSAMSSSSHPYGSREGDVVGFRVRRTEEGGCGERPSSGPAVRFRDVAHRFFRRGDAYVLYKTWSWPD